MGQTLTFFPGQQVTIFQVITNALGQRTDGYAPPVVSRIIFPGFTLAAGFPQTMLRLDLGLYYFQFVLPMGAGAVGSYEVEVMFQNPNTGIVNYNYFQVNVTAPFGSNSITVPSQPPIIFPVPGLPAPTGPASGDLGAFYPDPTVVGLQGQPISNVLPTLGQVLEWNGTHWAPTTFNIAGGDLSGTYPNPKVIAIQGNPIMSGSLTSAQDGYVLTWVNADGQWEPQQHTTVVFLSGDVVGISSANTVVNINGSSVPAGPLTTGNVLQANGSASLTYAPINLAGGSDFVTGVLPTGNQASQAMSGDVLGTTAASTVTLAGDVVGRSGTTVVGKINGNTVPTGTGNAVGNGLYVTVAGAAGTLAYSALNLAGGSNFVTGNLPVSNVAPGTSAQVLMSNGTPATTWTTVTGDVSITNTGVTTVLDIHGASVPVAGSLTTGNVLQVNGASSLTYGAVNLAGGANFVTGVLPAGNQANQTMGGDVTGTTAASTVVSLSGTTGSVQASIGSLGAGAGAHFASTGLIQVPNNNNAGALAFINERNNINTADQNILGYSFGVLTFGNTAQVTAVVGNSVQLNTANGTPFVVSTSAATMTGLPTFQWSANTPNPIITQVTQTSDVATNNLTISPQAPFASAVTNTTPGSLIVSLGVPLAGGNEAFFEINRASGGSPYIVGPLSTFPSVTAVWNGVTPSATNYSVLYGPTFGAVNYNVNSVAGAVSHQFFADGTTPLFFIGKSTVNGQGANLTGNNANFGAGVGVAKLTDATTLPTSKPPTSSLLYSNTGSLETTGSGYNFHNLATSPTVQQTAATSDVVTQNLTISSQAPFASAVTHTSPGNIVISTPAVVGGGTTLGQIQFSVDGYTVATLGNAGFLNGSVSVGITTGTTTLTVDQYCRPLIKLTGSLSGNVTIVLPAVDGAEWFIDASAITLNANSITLQANGNNWGTTISNTSLYLVTYSSGLGRLTGTTLSS